MNATMMVSRMNTTSVAEPRSGPGDRRNLESSVFILIMIACCSRRKKPHYPGKPPTLPEDSRRSTISRMVAVSNGNPIPLTLPLSHGEREQSAAGSVVREVRRADTVLGCAESQRKILPLPKGEGRLPAAPAACLPRRRRQAAQAGGEGKLDARFSNRVGTSPEVC